MLQRPIRYANSGMLRLVGQSGDVLAWGWTKFSNYVLMVAPKDMYASIAGGGGVRRCDGRGSGDWVVPKLKLIL